MAALTTDECKAYLRIQHDAEDLLLDSLRASALGMIEGWVGRPVYNRSVVEIQTYQGDPFIDGPRQLFFKAYPAASITSIVDCDGTALDQTDLFIDLRLGVVGYKSGARFTAHPYTLTVVCGLESYPEFSLIIEPVVRQAQLDLVADLYQRRNPAASAEREGGGVGVEYGSSTRSGVADNFREDGLVGRVAAGLAPWRAIL